MVVCEGCGQDMALAASCLKETVSLRGRVYERLRYGREATGYAPVVPARCHDCNVAPMGIHHAGCDVERCPRCAGQLVSCDCPRVAEEITFVYTRPQLDSALRLVADNDVDRGGIYSAITGQAVGEITVCAHPALGDTIPPVAGTIRWCALDAEHVHVYEVCADNAADLAVVKQHVARLFGD